MLDFLNKYEEELEEERKKYRNFQKVTYVPSKRYEKKCTTVNPS
jgi:hypothetical protein